MFISCKGKGENRNTFEITKGDFYFNNSPVQLISGEMHYSRIPNEYWRHRMKMLKAMGLNTVATYVFWNIHEPQPGQWDFSGDKNIAEFIKIADEEGLMVILRPGPYVCAEWEFGGYPWWLQNIKGIELRRDNEQFLERTGIYIERLFQEIGHLLVSKGGPIIMVQIENEFGAYALDRQDIPTYEHESYMIKLKKQLVDAGYDAPFFTSDWKFKGGTITGALPTANGITDIQMLRDSINMYNDNKGPYMVAEFYPGWLAHWCEPHPYKSSSDIARQTDIYLQNDVSINFYVVHGGTNFAFNSGANYNDEHDIQPDLTSYDYDAPISEAGWVTPKYDSIRNVISKHVEYSLPNPPHAIRQIEIPKILMTQMVDLLSATKKSSFVENDTPLSFEELNQGYGYVLYSYQSERTMKGELEILGLRDYALVYVNGKKIGELNRYSKNYIINIDLPENAVLDILVENMGRINYGSEIVNNTKGIISPVRINKVEIKGNWRMYCLPMSEIPSFNYYENEDVYEISQKDLYLLGKPALYRGVFDLKETGDTFIDMSEWGKGIIFINGKNIGRYWSVGPQQTLFIPGVWLNKGENEIIVFEQQNDKINERLKTIKTPILNQLN